MARMIMFEVGSAGRLVEVADFEAARKMIGGDIQVVPLTGGLSILCDEDGRMRDLPVNRQIEARAPNIRPDNYNFIVSMCGAPLMPPDAPGYHEILGTFLVCRGTLDAFESITDDDAARFRAELTAGGPAVAG